MAILRSPATRALISRSALAYAARAAVSAGGSVADLRRDAYGHGLLAVARAAHEAGAERMLVDGDEQVALLRDAGIPSAITGEADIPTALLYGFPGAGGESQQVMRLTGRVMSTKPLRRGEAVSYGYTHRAEEDTTVALVTGGYAQAVVRALGNRARLEIGGALHPIVGRVAMDVCVVDVGADAEPPEEGAEATFFGGTGAARHLIEEWAEITGLTAAELVCAAGLKATQGDED